MDPGTALALLTLIKPIVKTIVEAWQDAKDFGGDSRGFNVHFNTSKTILDHYEHILFDKDKLPGIAGRLYDNLPESERQTIFDILGELYLVLKTYIIARKRYELDSYTSRLSIDLEQDKEERDARLVSTAESKDAQQAHAGPLPFLTSLPRLQQLEKDYDAQQVGLLEDVPLRKLIALLHEAKDDRFKVLRCTNYFKETSERRINLIFQLPPGLDGPPSSLLAALSCSSSSRPSLTARKRLAHSLCETLMLLHSVNWLHKSIRSETTLLLHGGDILPPREAIPDLGNPRLCGFEYSRPGNDFTSGHPDFEIRRNIYRHPDRWGQPKESFSKIHDIYSPGVILLEVGLWKPITNLDKKDKKALVQEPYPDGAATKARLLRHATKRLGFFTGERYQSFVLQCLAGDFGDLTQDDKISSKLQARFGKAVLQVLGDGGGSPREGEA